MLVLTRKEGQSIIVDDDIEITIVEVNGDQIRVGINAPKSVKILRKEIYNEIQNENKKAASAAANANENQFRELGEIMKEFKLSK